MDITVLQCIHSQCSPLISLYVSMVSLTIRWVNLLSHIYFIYSETFCSTPVMNKTWALTTTQLNVCGIRVFCHKRQSYSDGQTDLLKFEFFFFFLRAQNSPLTCFQITDIVKIAAVKPMRVFFGNFLSVSLPSLHHHKGGQRLSPDVAANRWMLLSSWTGPPLYELTCPDSTCMGAAPSMRCTWQFIEVECEYGVEEGNWVWVRCLSVQRLWCWEGGQTSYKKKRASERERESERKTEEVEGGWGTGNDNRQAWRWGWYGHTTGRWVIEACSCSGTLSKTLSPLDKYQIMVRQTLILMQISSLQQL